jgi:hypothetical protein
MDLRTDFNAALKAVQDGQLDSKSEEDLASMIQALARWQASGGPGSHMATPAVEAIQKALDRRQKERHHEKEKSLTEKAILQGEEAHKETMTELKTLKILVDHLAQARPIDKAILVVGAIAAAAAVVAALIELFRKS